MLYRCFVFTLTFIQCRTNVEDVGPTLYKCYTDVLCLPGYIYEYNIVRSNQSMCYSDEWHIQHFDCQGGWYIVYDAGPSSAQHWVNVSCLPGYTRLHPRPSRSTHPALRRAFHAHNQNMKINVHVASICPASAAPARGSPWPPRAQPVTRQLWRQIDCSCRCIRPLSSDVTGADQ